MTLTYISLYTTLTTVSILKRLSGVYTIIHVRRTCTAYNVTILLSYTAYIIISSTLSPTLRGLRRGLIIYYYEIIPREGHIRHCTLSVCPSVPCSSITEQDKLYKLNT